MRKIQFASEFKLYDELTWRKEVIQTELIRKSNQERAEIFEMTSQPQFESFERNMDGPGQLTLMPGKISQQQPALAAANRSQSFLDVTFEECNRSQIDANHPLNTTIRANISRIDVKPLEPCAPDSDMSLQSSELQQGKRLKKLRKKKPENTILPAKLKPQKASCICLRARVKVDKNQSVIE